MIIPFIRTVLGDLATEGLGSCDAHEHVIIESGAATERYPDFLLNDVDLVSKELLAFRSAGGGWMVDTMPGGAGRNVRKLAAVSSESGVHVVACTGLHLAQYYADDHPLLHAEMQQLATYFVREIELGALDEGDNREPIRAGIIKVAGGSEGLDPLQGRAFDAAAAAHLATGCPILTHVEQGMAGTAQVEQLASRGVDLSRVTLSHLDRMPDIEYHRQLLDTGVNLEYDSGFRWDDSEDNPTLDLLGHLLPQYPDQLVLGMDAARSSYWRSYGGHPGLAWLMTRWRETLGEAGLSDDLLEGLYVRNPARAFAFVR